MKKYSFRIPWKHGVEKLLILLLCAVMLICTGYVLVNAYEPNQNALGALASVSMDAICLLILLVLVYNLMFEKSEISHTTGLFLGLLIGTMFAVFFDFLTWSSDGSLAYGEFTYVYTVSSLCSGSILACFFAFYLCSYLNDMYEMKAAFFWAKFCAVCDVISFIITITLAVTGNAFVLTDGHYHTGVLYDVVTVIPVLTLVLMVLYAVCHIKIIGIHDVAAVIGYIVIMISGALIEAQYSIGTTYVSVTIADIFIFVMLQNKIIDRARKQRQLMAEQITSQYEILYSMARIYSYVNYLDLVEGTASRFDENVEFTEMLDLKSNPHTSLNINLFEGIEEEHKEKFWKYTDLSTLPERMRNEKIISSDFCHKKDGWFRAQYIRIGDMSDESVDRVIYAIRNIDEEKKNVEKWIRRSNTDELTGIFNRRAYEEEIKSLKNCENMDKFVYVSIDVNGLKIVNDTLGHEAGDELLIGACECMKQCFGAYGKLFRIGGDEFVALIFADETQLDEIKKNITEVTENWTGSIVDHVALSCGYVSQKEAGNMTLHEMAVLADKRMYENKNEYYMMKGTDRRGHTLLS